MEKLIQDLGELPIFVQVILGGIVLFLLFRIFKNAMKLLFWLILTLIAAFLVIYFFEIDITQYINNGAN
jgi:glucan phosphoethanolaminetransferase (alkaline phosphatase superfamily)